MRCFASVVAWAVVAAVAGCGKGDGVALPVTDDQILTEIGAMYKGYTTDHKAAPRRLADFDHPYEPANIEGYAALRDGKYDMFWGGKLPGADAARTVLAYRKDVPEQGGPVLFQDGSTRSLTADEFKSAPKVGK